MNINITINDSKVLEATLNDNSSARALMERLQQGSVTYTSSPYGNFESVGDIGFTLPRNDTQITTSAGDVILYQGRNICLYYATNSWNFTRLGRKSKTPLMLSAREEFLSLPELIYLLRISRIHVKSSFRT